MGKGKDKKKSAVKAKAKPSPKVAVKKKAAKAPAKKKVVAKAKPVAKKKVVAKAKAKPVAKKPAAKPVAKKKTVVKPVTKKQVVSKPTAKKKVAAKPVKTVLKKVAPKAKPQLKKEVKPTAVVAAKPITKPVSAPKAVPVNKATSKSKPVDENLHRYSDEELKEFKTLIDKKLASAREELAYLKDALDNHTDSQAGNKAWNMEEGTDTSEMETLMNQISRQHTYIRNLELALVRIENKTYGICRATGQLIPKERLRVVPHATLSLEAKMSRKVEDSQSEQLQQAAPPSDFAENFED